MDSNPHPELATLPTDRPLVTGEQVVYRTGTPHAVSAASIVITNVDGTRVAIALEKRSDGNWWAPADGDA